MAHYRDKWFIKLGAYGLCGEVLIGNKARKHRRHAGISLVIMCEM